VSTQIRRPLADHFQLPQLSGGDDRPAVLISWIDHSSERPPQLAASLSLDANQGLPLRNQTGADTLAAAKNSQATMVGEDGSDLTRDVEPMPGAGHFLTVTYDQTGS
jgi:hypothetical protein